MVALSKKKPSRRGKKSLKNSKKDLLAKDTSNGRKKVYFTNPKQALEITFFLLFATLVIVICFLGQKPKGPQVILNQPAPKRIVAEFEFEYDSKLLLEREISSVSARVPPVFKRTFEPFDSFSKYINNLNSSIAKTLIDHESKKDEALLQEYGEKGEAALEIALTQTIDALTNGNEFKIAPETIIQFTKLTNPKERSALTNDALSVMKSIYQDGVHSNMDTGNNLPQVAVVQLIDETGNQNLPYARALEDALVALRVRLDALCGKREIARVLFDIFRHGLKENLIYSEQATKEAKANAIKKIPPQTIRFKEGETLIEPGQIVTEKNIESLAAYRKEERTQGNNSLIFNLLFLKHVILTLLLLLAIVAYVKYGLPTFYKDTRSIAITSTGILLNLLVIRLILEVGYGALSENSSLIALLPYIAPYTFTPIIIAALLGISPAIISALIISILFSILQGNSIEFLLIALLAGVAGSIAASNITKRAMLVKAGTIAGITAGTAVLILGLAGNLSLAVVGEQALISIIVGILIGVVSVGLLPVFEQLFKITTDITLLELTDFNHPLLRRMQVEAPGTYHHSLMVANLSENAAAEIGANPLLCRVCCFFHDIGKLVKPEYFTENQRQGINPHNEKNPSMSALVIKAHVKEGVELAIKHKLPNVIIDVIRQHHGTGLIQYFYHQAQQEQNKQIDLPSCDDQIKPQEVKKVDESTYRYDGPRPSFKESAIIFFADSVEAASRSLKKITQPAIEELIDRIIKSRIADGQLDECPLTFQELYAIKSSFTYTLLNMLHSRVEYPKEANETKEKAEPAPAPAPEQNNEPATTGDQQPV
jgi:putative nucleotidyltransferase with HDIG domain